MIVTISVVVPLILPAAALFELATLPVGVHELASQVGKVVNDPLVAHFVLPPPEYPVSHVITTVSVVVPIILPAAALFEFATPPVGVQDLGAQVNALNLLFVPHVTVPVPEYPVSHVTVTVSVVFPVMVPAAALFELAILPLGMQVLALHFGKVVNFPFVAQVVLPPPE